MSDRQTIYIRGTAFWAKIVGDPVPNYAKDGYEWVMDLALDDAGIKQIKGLKPSVADRIKDKDDERGKFMVFKQRANRADGTPNKAPKIVDANGKPWDDRKIGNGSKVDVKFTLVDYGKGKKPGIYLQGIRVLDHVEYASNDFPALTPDDEFFKEGASTEATTFKEDFGLDDDLAI